MSTSAGTTTRPQSRLPWEQIQKADVTGRVVRIRSIDGKNPAVRQAMN